MFYYLSATNGLSVTHPYIKDMKANKQLGPISFDVRLLEPLKIDLEKIIELTNIGLYKINLKKFSKKDQWLIQEIICSTLD